MSTEENKAAVSRMLHEVILGGDLALMDELMASDFINHGSTGASDGTPVVGVENFREEIRAMRSALSDIGADVIHLLAEGDYVVLHVNSRGTHTGEFGGMPPTGKKIENRSISIVRFAGGKLAERWNLSDRFGVLQQLGILPGR